MVAVREDYAAFLAGKAPRVQAVGIELGRPYCGEHCAVAYVRVRDRREDAA